MTAFPYLYDGISGYYPDLAYHLLRVEGVKDALQAHSWPAAVYDNFFGDYGYGSPLFYPDIFLVPAAILRMTGLGPAAVWKMYSMAVCLLVTASTFFSMRWTVRIAARGKDEEDSFGGTDLIASCGTLLLVLSQFYLADLQVRVGISEYLAFAFLPLLCAGIYAFFAGEGGETQGKGSALIGAGLSGLLLTHTISFLIGFLLTAAVFLISLLFKDGRGAVRRGIKGILISAAVSIAGTAYYTFPMLEQMASGTEFKYRTPWAMIGDMVQPLETLFRTTGYFFNIAYVGIGLPVLLALFFGLSQGRGAKRGALIFLAAGAAILLSMTGIVPWRILEGTVLNMLQFTFRLYPAGLCAVCFGFVIAMASEEKERRVRILLMTGVLAVLFGVWQNVSAVARGMEGGVSGFHTDITEESLKAENSFVGMGEWLPVSFNTEVSGYPYVYLLPEGEGAEPVYPQIEFIRQEKKVGGVFPVSGSEGTVNFIVPQVWYKGYAAKYERSGSGGGEWVRTQESPWGQVMVSGEFPEDGTIAVVYRRTLLQKMSLVLSLLTAAGLILRFFHLIKRAGK